MYTEVFISYAREDEDLAGRIVKVLETEGLIIWWDKRIAPSSKQFRYEIEGKLKNSRCVLVLWTVHSHKSDWVISEAEKAKDGGTLFQVCTDREYIPMPFGTIQCEQLSLRNGEVTDAALDALVQEIKKKIGIIGPNEHIVLPFSDSNQENEDYPMESFVPGTDIMLSFKPRGLDGVFLLMHFDTTDGWVPDNIETSKERHRKFEEIVDSEVESATKNKHKYVSDDITYLNVCNDIYIIKDPLRPFTVQIGVLRSKRPHKEPGIISGNISTDHLDTLPIHFEWLSMSLAEIVSNETTLDELFKRLNILPDFIPISKNEDELIKKKKKILNLIGRNPNAPKDIQTDMCRFCNKIFREKHALSVREKENKYGAFVVANDYPFGPFFHYLAITNDPVHFWEDMQYKHLAGLNLIVHDFLQRKDNLKGASGIGFGFNSTVRHLVLGSHTRSSAGASIPHVHKQVWGLASGTSNLAEQLITVSQSYWNHNIDYQDAYLKALDRTGYVVWSGDHVVLYVPYGQCSLYELQVMTIQPRRCFSELTIEEVVEFSKAEYIALRLFKVLGIKSFNHVMLSKLFTDNRAPKFRLVECFVTREIDLAVSELSALYVVDQHPWESRSEIVNKWEKIKNEILCEMSESEIN